MKVLDGNTDLILKEFYKDLKNLAAHKEYEKAILVRDKIFRFQSLLTQRFFAHDAPHYNISAKSTESLQNLLKEFYPSISPLKRIECFDVSNLGGADSTASRIVFTDGLIDKSQYRRYKIQNLSLKSDFEMMTEVLRRRFKNAPDNAIYPDLLIIDGGKPQLRFVKQLFSQEHIDIPTIGIAKHPDRLVIMNTMTTIRPALKHIGFNLVRSIRDESHRFAKKYHVYLRNKKLMI